MENISTVVLFSHLKVENPLTELLPLFCVRNCLVEGSLTDSNHLNSTKRTNIDPRHCSSWRQSNLRADADSTFVEHRNSVLVTFAFFAEQVFHWNLKMKSNEDRREDPRCSTNFTIVEMNQTGRRSFETKFVFPFSDSQTFGFSVDDERRDSFVFLRREKFNEKTNRLDRRFSPTPDCCSP